MRQTLVVFSVAVEIRVVRVPVGSVLSVLSVARWDLCCRCCPWPVGICVVGVVRGPLGSVLSVLSVARWDRWCCPWPVEIRVACVLRGSWELCLPWS